MSFIPIACPTFGQEEAAAVSRQILSGWISMGDRVKELEARICDHTGAAHAIAMSNGTATLHAALLALGVGPGDEVVLPTLSYVSSANAVLYCGATPVFCEVDPATFNVTADTVAAALTPATKVIMPVDLKGQPVDFDNINKLAEARDIRVLSDSAESFGAIYRGARVGIQCDLHSFSFFANKNVTMGEGGAVTTDDADLAELCRCIRNQGQSERYVHVMLGHNYRLTDIVAAFGVVQMDRLEDILTEKARIAAIYDQAFANHPLITPPWVPEYCDRPSWYMYSITLTNDVDRDGMIEEMARRGVDHRLSFPPIHLQPFYREQFGYGEGDFPVSEDVFRRFVDIPCWAGMTDSQIEQVVDAVQKSAEAALR